MEYRVGLCSSCGASFKVPASFSADKAKCKVCSGVVEIGPVQSDAPPPVPTRKPAPTAGKEKPEGPSMKERLLAERRAAEEAAARQSKPSAIPSKTVDRPGSRASGLPVGAAPKARAVADVPTGKIARGASKPVAGAGSRTSSGGPTASVGVGAHAGAGAGAGAAAGAGSRRKPASGRRRGGKDDADDAEEGTRGRRGSRAREKQNPVVLITAGLLVVGAAAAAGWFFLGGDKAPEGGADSSLQAAGTTDNAPNTATSADGGAQTAGTPAANDTTGGAAAGTPAADGAGDATAAAPGEGAPATETPKPPKAAAVHDPASVDLTALEELGPVEGVGAEEWQRIRDLVATALDPESAVAGNRARRELEGMGKPAFPAIINMMRTLDYSTLQGCRNGDIAQQMLEAITNGRNYGWQYTAEPNDEWYNKTATRNWHNQWLKMRDNETEWRTFAKITGDAGGSEEPAGGLDEDDLDALDDL